MRIKQDRENFSGVSETPKKRNVGWKMDPRRDLEESQV